MLPSIYDIDKSYEDNYQDGPVPSYSSEIKKREIKTKQKFLGFEVNVPFGIPAGPLLNSRYLKAAFDLGFDVNTYKTVRTNFFPCHPYPNVRYIQVENELHPDKTPKLIIEQNQPDYSKINITNSFGVPSQKPEVWQEDVKRTLSQVGEGQLLILSFMGTVKEGQSKEDFIADNVLAAKLANETGAKVLEINLSCPNIGNEGLICYDVTMTQAILKAVRKEIGNTKLVIKVGYYKDQTQLEKIAEIGNNLADAVCSINTLQVEVINQKGEQALPGKNRLRSGVCGAGIKWAGLEMVERLKKLKDEKSYNYEIIGVGGVMTANDYKKYREAGADCVQSATGAMWNPHLAYEVFEQSS